MAVVRAAYGTIITNLKKTARIMEDKKTKIVVNVCITIQAIIILGWFIGVTREFIAQLGNL